MYNPYIDTGDIYGKKYDIILFWTVTTTCNFSCPQCLGNAKKPKKNVLYAPEKINISALKQLLKRSGKTFKFVFSGGEPLFVRNLIKAFKMITRNHYADLMSNMTHPDTKKFAMTIDPQRVPKVVATAHMHELNKYDLLEKFISHCLLFKEKGFNLYLSAVAYPYLLNKVDLYKEVFKKYGLDLCFKSFTGVWKGKNYPKAYTDEEIKKFDLNTYEYYSPEIFYQKGKVCNAGYNVSVVLNNGDVHPCYSITKKSGHIYKEINFKNKLINCPFDLCTCPFSIYESYLFQKALYEIKKQESKI